VPSVVCCYEIFAIKTSALPLKLPALKLPFQVLVVNGDGMMSFSSGKLGWGVDSAMGGSLCCSKCAAIANTAKTLILDVASLLSICVDIPPVK
jgi:hypothetical protein